MPAWQLWKESRPLGHELLGNISQGNFLLLPVWPSQTQGRLISSFTPVSESPLLYQFVNEGAVRKTASAGQIPQLKKRARKISQPLDPGSWNSDKSQSVGVASTEHASKASRGTVQHSGGTNHRHAPWLEQGNGVLGVAQGLQHLESEQESYNYDTQTHIQVH